MSENEVRCPAGAIYTVKEGDTFADIAARYNLTAGELAALNPYADPGSLAAGQALCVPGDDGEAAAPQDEPPRAEACPDGYEEGVVQAGDTYASLLQKYDISYQAFRLTNPGLQPASLRAGQRYCVPPAGTRRVCLGGAASYVIGAGETLQTLSEKLNVTPGRLLRLNPTLAPSDFEEGRQICVIEAQGRLI
ncbi:MAG: LysM peptidoglycan-binding domain-containing protein [Clostridia bacterium]|nr:LysM peptidoglycan-binding domain-containing protein [Clostridia bacterium]